ncbi:two-component system response regulator [Paramagnetospirillum kuznetsovii]|uniref:Two-component system response regulator n=2 Tax=Paramagnetospirillum TaxID=3031148 RepID=A0A364NT12_9PROT|nr:MULTISPECIES: response regulator [Rhodospirillales]RAU20208.1 two-component system response regulator [Paramagnetospirillum kuznetsovii]
MDNAVRRAVIVEDSPQMRELIRMVLGSLGFQKIVQASNGAEALDALQAEHTDLIIMDWMMEVMDGLECTRRIRGGVNGIDPAVPIVLLTGNKGKESEASAYNAGVSVYLEKPFSIKQLHSGVMKALGLNGVGVS